MKIRKTGLALLSGAGILLSLAACASGNGPKAVAPALEPGVISESSPRSAAAERTEGKTAELTVFACSSLQDTLREIAASYQNRASNVILRFCFDASGELLERIKEGAACDLFLSASPAQIDAIDGSLLPEVNHNPDRPALIDPSSRIDLLRGGLVLAVPDGNPAGISSFEELARSLRGWNPAAAKPLLAMGGSGDPEGQYAREILRSWQADGSALDTAAGQIAVCSDEREIAARLSEGSADCGVLFSTESGNFTVVDVAPPEYSVRYTAAVLLDSAHREAAQAFLDYLAGPEAAAVFEAAGFTHGPPEEDLREEDAQPPEDGSPEEE